jgi:hypothetical protein
MSRIRSSGGFTFVEVALGSVLVLCGFGTLLSVWRSSDRLTAESYAHLRAEAEHRRNLQAIAGVLRDVVADSLAGLDANGRSTAPRFRRVTGMTGTTVTQTAEQSLSWAADGSGRRTPTGQRLGSVLLFDGVNTRLLAADVPEGDFSVRRLGRRLVVSLTTRWTSSSQDTNSIAGTTELSLRN